MNCTTCKYNIYANWWFCQDKLLFVDSRKGTAWTSRIPLKARLKSGTLKSGTIYRVTQDLSVKFREEVEKTLEKRFLAGKYVRKWPHVYVKGAVCTQPAYRLADDSRCHRCMSWLSSDKTCLFKHREQTDMHLAFWAPSVNIYFILLG